MENMFRYDNGMLHVNVSTEMLPKAVSVIKEYLSSRLYSDQEREENPMDFLDRTLKSMPNQMAMGLSEAQINKILTIRKIGLQVQQKVYGEIAAIPDNSSGRTEINITRGYRPGNVAHITVMKYEGGTASIQLHFSNTTGDESRPLRWMQYDALLAKAKEAGFNSDKGTLDQEVETFRTDDSTYFRTGPIDEVMSAFEWSELEAAVNFLWKGDLPDDMKKKLGK